MPATTTANANANTSAAAPPQLHQHIHFSDEQAMLLETATAFAREQSPSALVRQRLDLEEGFDNALWQRMVEMGWTGLAVPEAQGGSGLPAGHLALLAEPLGRHLLATPLGSSALVVQGLLAASEAGAGDGPAAALAGTWLPRLAAGAIGSVALFEEDGGWDLGAPMAEARPAADSQGDRDGWQLQGRKTLVLDAAVAELLLVSLRCEGELALALLPTKALPPGARVREQVIDGTRRSYLLTLDGVHLPRSALITGTAARAALDRIRQAALLWAAAEAAGGLAGVLDLLVDYLNTREAFGRKIGSYQGLKHPMADMLVALERSRSLLAHAATLMNEGAAMADIDLALALAKAEAGEGLLQAGDRAVQFHGGFGFTWDCDAQLYLRRGVWLQAWFGDAAHHRQQAAAALWPM